MQDNSNEASGKGRRFGMKLALIGAGVAVGAITATTVGANALTIGSTAAASTSSTSTSSTSSAPTTTDVHGHNSMRGDEKIVTGANAAKLKAAALKAVPGGTVDRVETDSGDATYEAHMTKSDGTDVTVKFDKNLAVTGAQADMGRNANSHAAPHHAHRTDNG